MVKSKDGTEREFRLKISGKPLNFAAKIPSSTEVKSRFSVIFKDTGGILNPTRFQGKVTFRAKISADASDPGEMGFVGAWYNSYQRRITHLRAHNEGTIDMFSPLLQPGSVDADRKYQRENGNGAYLNDWVLFDQRQTPDRWFEVEYTWQKASPLSFITLKIDGVPVSSEHEMIPADPSEAWTPRTIADWGITHSLSELEFTMPHNEESGGMGALYIDDIKDNKYDTPYGIVTYSNGTASLTYKNITNYKKRGGI